MKPVRDRSKLPRWAQQELDRLERDLQHANSKLSAGPEDSDTFADPYSVVPRPLGKGPTIAFKYGERMTACYRVRLDDDGETLEVSGGTSIAIHPRASNSIEIRIVS